MGNKKTSFPKPAREYLSEHGLLKSARKLGILYFTPDKVRKRVGLPKDRKPSDGIGIRLRQSESKAWSIRFLRAGAKPKFKQSFNSHNEFLLSPDIEWKEVKHDTEQELWMVEGWNSSFVLCESDILAVGLNGVYGWRSGGKPIKDFETDHWEWKGRKVRVCYDSDVLYKDDVSHALVRLCRHLKKLGADVWITVIEGPYGSKIGPGDVLVKKGADALLALPAFRLGEGYSREWAAPKHVRKLNDELAFTVLGTQAMIIRTEPDPANPQLRKAITMRPNEVRDVYATHSIEVEDAKGNPKLVPLWPLWMANKGRREVTALVVDAARPFGYDPITRQFNMWRGFNVKPHKPDAAHSCELFKAHLRDVICSKNKEHYTYLWRSLAWWIQHATDPSGVAIALIGEEGAGKGFVFEHFGRLFGEHYIALDDSEHLLGRFTGHLRGKVVVFLDEAIFAGSPQQRDKLFHKITEPTITEESKGKDAVSVRNDKKYALATNHSWAVPAGLKSRRFFVLRVQDTHCNDFKYFKAIADQLEAGGYAAMLYELQNEKLTNFEIRAIPKTSALLEQKRLSFDPVTAWYFDCLQRGSLTHDGGEWNGRITRDAIYEAVKSEYGLSKYDERSLSTEVGQKLKKLCPKVQHKQPHRGPRYYKFPKLDLCREQFEKFICQRVEWNGKDA